MTERGGISFCALTSGARCREPSGLESPLFCGRASKKPQAVTPRQMYQGKLKGRSGSGLCIPDTDYIQRPQLGVTAINGGRIVDLKQLRCFGC